jgi:hypothetical protein
MMKISSAAAAILLFGAGLADAESASPERQVSGNAIRSDRDPAVRIELPASARHVGAHRWTLYDVADCELHVFVEADESKRVQRLYWIQFEGYVPSRPELKYDYSENATTDFAGRPFFVNASAGEPNRKPRAGSDLEQVQQLIRANGYTLPDHSINVRLVNLFDGDRKELMIIYAEDLRPTGFTSADLNAGGRAEKERHAIERKLIENARARITLDWTGKADL